MRTWILAFVYMAGAYLMGFCLYSLYDIHKNPPQNSLVYFYCDDPKGPFFRDVNLEIPAKKVAHKYPQLSFATAPSDNYLWTVYDGFCLPGFELFVPGFKQPIFYQGDWSASDIVDWVDRTMKALTEVKKIEEIKEIVDNNEVVALFLPYDELSVYSYIINSVSTAPHYYENFGMEVEGSLRTDSVWDDTVFIYSMNSKVREFYQVKDDTLILFDKFNQTQKIFKGPFNTESLREFMGSINTMTRISRLRWDSNFNLVKTSFSMIFLVRTDDEAGYQAEKAFREAVKSLRGKMVVYVFNFRYPRSQDLDRTFPISGDDLPAIRTLHPAKTMLKYAYQENNFTVDGIKNFIDKFLVGNLIPFYISDPLPVNEYENNVRVVVGETFEKIVLDEEKDVLLLMPNSQNPVFLHLLAEKFKDIEDFVLAIMNPKTNEVDGIKRWQNINQARFYPKNLKHSPIIINQKFYEYEMPINMNIYIQFFKRYAFIAGERQSQFSCLQPQASDIISWAEKQPHPLCDSEDLYTRFEIPDQSKITAPVLSVVEGNFSKIVLDDENDVFLVAYTPGYDITKFFELAKKLVDVKNLVFAKIDSSVNEVAGVKEYGPPIYWLYPRNKKHAPIIYDLYRFEEELFLFFLNHRGTFSSEYDCNPKINQYFECCYEY